LFASSRVPRLDIVRNGHVLASPGEGGPQLPITIDGGGDVPYLSTGGGEVHYYALLYLRSKLAVVQYGQLGPDGRVHTGEIASPLRCPMLSADLLSTG
jgi:hypothetical protein